MNKLKTMKDMKVSSLNPMFNAGAEMQNNRNRDEAIKWVKEIIKDGIDTRPQIFDGPLNLETINKDIQEKILMQETDIVVRWIIHFFNITEKELK